MYLNLTGDYDLHGGYYPDRVSLAMTTDFTGLVKNAMNKIIVQRWGELGVPVTTGGRRSPRLSTLTP